jgi:hypothetical protein
MTNRFVYCIVLAFMAFLPGARAQFLWEVSQNDHDWRYINGFTALSCYGPICTAGGVIQDNLKSTVSLMFMRSTDGGHSWIIQDPHLDTNTTAVQFWEIQQIDSLTAVAVGDSGLIVRTTDAGISWARQDCKSKLQLRCVNFSDPLTGIIGAYGSELTTTVLTTVDGGLHWDSVTSFSASGITKCHSYGNGKFSVFLRGTSPIVTTFDNWKTVKLMNRPVDPASDTTADFYYFNTARYCGNDTIFILGIYGFNGEHGAIVRSIDGGEHWDTPFTSSYPSKYYSITGLEKDTLFAAGEDILGYYSFSTDRGNTWKRDSLRIIKKDYGNGGAEFCRVIEWAGDSPLRLFSEAGIYSPNFTGILRGAFSKSSVIENYDNQPQNLIYPNPASSIITIFTNREGTEIIIFDQLGREMKRVVSLPSGATNFTVKDLPNGIYTVIFRTDGRGFVFGKFIVAKKE